MIAAISGLFIPKLSKQMNYIFIETHGGPEYVAIVTDTDGNNLVFEIRAAAEAGAADCQDGLIVEV